MNEHPRAHPIQGDLHAVDLTRLDDALDAIRFLLDHLTEDGRYEVDERWGPESNLYLAEIAWVFLEAHRITGEAGPLNGARAVLDRLGRLQSPSGGWSLDLGPDGLEFTATEAERRPTWENEDPPVVGAVAYAVAKYQNLTGDDRYHEMVDRGLAYLLPKWIPDGGYFSEDREEHLSSLRSNPAAYQVMFLLGLAAWRAWRPDLEPVVERLVRSIRTAFEAFDDQTMPFMRAFHALLMLQHGSGSYIATEVRPRIESLVESQVYRCPTIEGGYGHRDGARGIVTSEANMRGSGAVAIAARFYDLATATNSFGTSVAYLDMAAWIDGMKAEGSGYREYQQDSDGQRRGLGSPGQYIPCWWIFGAL